MKKVNLGIVGATGMVGRTFLKILEERSFPIENLYLFSSKKSAGQEVEFMGSKYIVEELTEDSFSRDMDIALFSAGGGVSSKFAPIASANGVIVVDNSSAWRMDPTIPLVVPEVNPGEISNHGGIIANPNCSTIQSVVPLKALDDAFGIKRIVYNTYQSVSGSGVAGIRDLELGIEGKKNENYPYPIAYNCLPHIDLFLENGYTKEEMKMVNETRKILGREDLRITATAVRVPVKYAHCVSANLEFENQFELQDAFEVLRRAPGVVVQDDLENLIYPLPIKAEGKDEVFVGRIRRDESLENGLNIWIVADNIRKGAATNTVQIAELLIDTL